jgi:hypothetical protein
MRTTFTNAGKVAIGRGCKPRYVAATHKVAQLPGHDANGRPVLTIRQDNSRNDRYRAHLIALGLLKPTTA